MLTNEPLVQIELTWIIIVLIVLSIVVTCSEVFLRFGILTKGKTPRTAALPMCMMPDMSTQMIQPLLHEGL